MNSIHTKILSEFKKYLVLHGYSNTTQKVYLHHTKNILDFFGEQKFWLFHTKDFDDFLFYHIDTKKYSNSAMKQLTGSLNLLFRGIFNKDLNLKIQTKNIKTSLSILSVMEIHDMLSKIENIKHKAILSTLYSGGLRLSELTNLKIHDIDGSSWHINIHADTFRQVPLANNLLSTLREYYQKYSPEIYLFEGRNNQKYSNRSIQAMIQSITKKIGVISPINAQTLRDSFAVHMLEGGISIPELQQILGHKNRSATNKYKQYIGKKKIQNPLDI